VGDGLSADTVRHRTPPHQVRESWTNLGEGTPRDGLRVERLNLLARPDVGALGVEEQLALSADNRLHNDELEDGADDGAERLDEEGDARRELGVLRHLEVARERQALGARVVAVQGEVLHR